MNENNVFFSVVIPAYNRRNDLLRALNSLKCQSFQNFEVIVVDDNSTEDLSSVINSFSFIGGLKYIKFNENKGAAHARNVGVENSSGSYIAFLDSDDEFCESKLLVYYNFIKKQQNPERKVLFSRCFVNRGGQNRIIRPSAKYETGSDVMEYIFVDWGLISTITLVLAKELALSYKFNPNLRRHQDYDFCLNLFRKGCEFVMIDEPLSIWNDIPSTKRITNTTGYEASKYWFEIAEQNLTEDAKNAYLSRVLAPMVRPKFKALSLLFNTYFKVKRFKHNYLQFIIFTIKIISPELYKKFSTLFVKITGK